MKRILIRTIKIAALLLPALLLVLLDPGNSSDERNKIRDFYREPENSLDVVVLGASEVFTDYSALLSYEEFGFASYPFAMSSNRMDLYRSQLEEIYKEQSPQLVVVEITPGLYPEPPSNMDMPLRGYLNRVPISWNKLRTAWEFGDRDHLLSYFLPFLMYHGTGDLDTILTTVSDELFLYRQGYSLLKNNSTSTLRDYSGDAVTVTGGEDGWLPLPEYTENTLRTFLDDCTEKGYDNLLFVTFPHRITTEYAYERYLNTRAAGELIESYGYQYLNLEPMSEMIGLDPERDFYNDDHMNLYGQEKFTRYLCGLLTESFGIQASEQTAENLERWQTAAEYGNRYYDHFDRSYREKPEETIWLWENKWVIQDLEEMKK